MVRGHLAELGGRTLNLSAAGHPIHYTRFQPVLNYNFPLWLILISFRDPLDGTGYGRGH
jgi:hypothetical protein